MKTFICCTSPRKPFEVEVESLDMPYLKANLRDILFDVFEDDLNEALTQYEPEACGFFQEPYEMMGQVYAEAIAYLTREFGSCALRGKVVDDSGATMLDTPLEPKITDVLTGIIEARSTNNDVVDFDLGPFLIKALGKFLTKATWQMGMIRDDDGSVMRDPKSWPMPVGTDHGLKWLDGDVLLVPSLWFGLEGEDPINCWTLSLDTGHLTALGDFWAFDWFRLLNGYEDTLTVWMFARRGLEEPETARVVDSCPIQLNDEGFNDDLQGELDKLFVAAQGIEMP